MTVARCSRVERYRRGRTLNIPVVKDSGILSIKECSTLLRISSRTTINEYLKVLSFFGQDFLNWDEFREILELQVFLGLKPGQNSKGMYRFLRDNGSIPQIFQESGVDIEEKFRRKQREYWKQQWQGLL